MKILILIVLILCTSSSFAQLDPRGPFIHSHNDYAQEKPLFGALKTGAKSIEIDVFLQDDDLFVAHSKSEIEKEDTLENVYLRPLKEYLAKTEVTHDFHFLIDIKSEPVSTLSEIEKTLKKYHGIFSKEGVQVIISGNRPKTEHYSNYASFIWFDGREPADLKKPGSSRIGMISQNLSEFTRWRGEGEILGKEKLELVKFIKQCHKDNVPVRLWNTGDTEKMYNFLYSLGVDYINTDNPKALQNFLRVKSHQKNK